MTDRAAFLASLAPGLAVHFARDIGHDSESHTDATVVKVDKVKIRIMFASGETMDLDTSGYVRRSSSVRIQVAEGSAAEWNADHRARAATYRQQLRDRAALGNEAPAKSSSCLGRFAGSLVPPILSGANEGW